MPLKTEFLLFYDASRELRRELHTSGSITLSTSPPVSIVFPKVTGGSFLEVMFNPGQVKAIVDAIRECAAFSYSYDESATIQEGARNTLIHTQVGLQLIKPVRGFGKYWFRTDEAGSIDLMSHDLGMIHLDHSPSPYLWYQQHNTISVQDVESAKRILPRLLQAFSPDASGSWGHPAGPVHRALIMFAQGYLTEMFHELRQFLWAMGLDCLFASKLDKRQRGARTIDQRLRMLLGAEFEPYRDVLTPGHHRPEHKLSNIVGDIFLLRNAVAHGLTIPDAWLTARGHRPYEGYAYQLAECTEIILRRVLLMILNDQKIFDVFVDSRRLDRYFG